MTSLVPTPRSHTFRNIRQRQTLNLCKKPPLRGSFRVALSPSVILCTPPQASRHGLEAMLRIHLVPLHGASGTLAAGWGWGGGVEGASPLKVPQKGGLN